MASLGGLPGARAACCDGFSCCRALAQSLQCLGLVAPWFVGSPLTRG